MGSTFSYPSVGIFVWAVHGHLHTFHGRVDQAGLLFSSIRVPLVETDRYISRLASVSTYSRWG